MWKCALFERDLNTGFFYLAESDKWYKYSELPAGSLWFELGELRMKQPGGGPDWYLDEYIGDPPNISTPDGDIIEGVLY